MTVTVHSTHLTCGTACSQLPLLHPAEAVTATGKMCVVCFQQGQIQQEVLSKVGAHSMLVSSNALGLHRLLLAQQYRTWPVMKCACAVMRMGSSSGDCLAFVR